MKKAKSDEEAADKQRRQAALDTIVPDLLRNNQTSEDENNEDGPESYLDLLLDEEEAFLREYRQRLIEDGFYE